MDLKTAKQIFLTAKQAQLISKATYRLYGDQVKRFFLYAMDQGIFDVEKIDSELINAYLAEFKASGVRNNTVHRDFRIIRTLMRYLFQNDYIRKNPMKGVNQPIKEQRVMRTFNSVEIKKIFNSFDQSDFYGYRNYTITSLFFSTGIRKMELAGLRMADLSLTGEFLKICGKGQKERVVPIGKSMGRILKHYLELREDFLTRTRRSTPFIFFTKRASQVSSDGLGLIFSRIKKELNMEGERFSCHTWRHTFAKNYLLNGGDIFSLQKIMGHSDIATTRQYLNLNENEIKGQHLKYNPLDNTDWLI